MLWLFLLGEGLSGKASFRDSYLCFLKLRVIETKVWAPQKAAKMGSLSHFKI